MSTHAELQPTDISWSWLKRYSQELYALDDSPLLGESLPFPWDKLSKELENALGLSGLVISSSEIAWKEAKDLTSGLPTPYLWSSLAASGIEGDLTILVSRQSIEWLLAKTLKIPLPEAQNQSAEIIDSFYKFLCAETVDIINTLQVEKKSSFGLIDNRELKTEPALCLDVWAEYDNARILIRVIMSNSFRKGWKALKPKTAVKPDQTRLQNSEVTLHVEVGRTWIPLTELLKAETGDFLLLDCYSYDPDNAEKKRCVLTLEDKVLFNAQLEQGSLKILEIPQHHEVYESMVDHMQPNQDPPEDDEDEDDEDIFTEDMTEEYTEEEDLFGEEDEETQEAETEEDVVTSQEEVPDEAVPPAQRIHEPIAAPVVEQKNLKFSEPVTPSDIPVCLAVEVAQLRLSVQKLLDLQPGNLLDLNISVENGVNLVVNGKIIGRGEMIKVGETLGVRILEIGNQTRE